MSLSKARELREQRGKLILDAQKLYEGEVTAETRSKFDTMMADADVMLADINRIEKAEADAASIRSAVRPPENQIEAATSTVEFGSEYRTAFTNGGVKPLHLEQLSKEVRSTVQTRNAKFSAAVKDYLAKGDANMSPESRAILNGQNAEFRDMGVGTTTLGGFLIPQGYVYDIDQALKYYGPMLNTSTVMQTASGQPLPYPTSNDTSNVGAILAEGTQVSTQDVTIGSLTFGAFKFTTNMVKVSIELLQDSAFDIDSFIKAQFAQRLGRILNTKFTVGVGTTEPKGIIVAATAGPTALGSAGNDGTGATGANSIGSDDLIALEHSVDPLYRPGAAFMMHDSTLKAVKQLKDKQGRPLYMPGFAVGAPDTIMGYRYFINNDMATIATTNKTVLFGQLSKYLVRQVKELAIVRLNERFADFGQVAFVGFARYDGNLIDAGTHPVKYLVQA